MTATDTALRRRLARRLPAGGRGARAGAGRVADDRRAGPRDRHPRQRRRPHAAARRRRRGRRLRRAGASSHEQGHRFHAVSEERGEVDFGSDSVRVIIDPIDGSLNAKRSTPHYALSVAVADGPTMADVAFGFVHDFGAGEQFWAWRGRGGLARQPSEPAGSGVSTRRSASGATATASSSWSGSRPRTRAGCATRSTGSARPRTGCARSVRSRSPCARSPPRGWTGW